ncbi:hypothetical protein M885DRAFT_74484 [Pelagophyceae sp. CCMP2097]|nr:hypothetical protein M885DRAFT_74484 [Pelagophyceae sp. CCMP2097]
MRNAASYKDPILRFGPSEGGPQDGVELRQVAWPGHLPTAGTLSWIYAPSVLYALAFLGGTDASMVDKFAASCFKSLGRQIGRCVVYLNPTYHKEDYRIAMNERLSGESIVDDDKIRKREQSNPLLKLRRESVGAVVHMFRARAKALNLSVVDGERLTADRWDARRRAIVESLETPPAREADASGIRG